VRGVEKPPAGVPWQEYAWRRLTEANPLPSVMGRVCPAPCESGCNRNQVEDFVGINSVEHFLGEYAIEKKLAFPKPTSHRQDRGRDRRRPGRPVGGLPAGAQGPRVTIFDERAELGGMMRYGIPGFRTPRPCSTPRSSASWTWASPRA
jgi:NADPH-dependent glutamate synthase beta subunit-like oxidoreductase